MAESLKSLPDSCRNSCEFAIGYANPPPYLDANTYDPCISGGWLNSHLEICLRCADALAVSSPISSPTSVSSSSSQSTAQEIRGYILAQVYDQLLSCGPDTWAGPYLPVTQSGDTIWSVAKTTHVVTAWKDTTVSTVIRKTASDGGVNPVFGIVTKVALSSVPVATWATTEKFWVEFVIAPTGTDNNLKATGVPPPMTLGSGGSDGKQNANVGVIIGGVVAGLVVLMGLLTAGWIFLRKRRRKRAKMTTTKEESELGDYEVDEKRASWGKPPVEMDTEREKVEIGDGEVYHEMGSSCEAFELDAMETEVQEKKGQQRKFGPEEEHVYLAREKKKKRPDSTRSNKSSESRESVVTSAERNSSHDKHRSRNWGN